MSMTYPDHDELFVLHVQSDGQVYIECGPAFESDDVPRLGAVRRAVEAALADLPRSVRRPVRLRLVPDDGAV